MAQIRVQNLHKAFADFVAVKESNFTVRDGEFYGIDLTNYAPDYDFRSLKDAHFPWVVEKMADFAVEKALSGEPTPAPPHFRELMLR